MSMTADAAMMGMDTQERLGNAFARSVVFHVVLFGGLTGLAWWNAGEAFGDPDAGGTAVGIEAVATIPLPPKSGPENPVANDTENIVPPAPAEKPAPKAAPPPEPEDAIALKQPDRKQKTPPAPKAKEEPAVSKAKEPLTPKQRLKSFSEIASNQLTSKEPQAVSSPLYSQGGAGRIGSDLDTTLGTRFPAYAARIQELTRQNWRTQDIDRSVSVAPPVTVRFDLMKDGHVESVRLIRRSGIPSLDESVLSAIETAHYPQLPDGYDRNSVPVEFTFELKR